MDFSDFEWGFAQAVAEGALPHHGDDVAASDEARRMTGRWLLWLGYLKNTGQLAADHHQDVDSALAAFRRDCGLDEEDGEDVLERLRELVAFESATPVVWWLDPRRRAALWRGIGLRLFAFNLVSRSPRPALQRDQIAAGLREFIVIAQASGLKTSRTDRGVNANTIRALFDQDLLSQKLGQTLATRTFRYAKNATNAERKRVSQRIWSFIAGVAAVELWLNGYAVEIGSDKQSALRFNDRRFTLKRGLQQFWKDQDLGKERTPALESIEEMLTAFFPRLDELSVESAAIKSGVEIDLVEEVLKSPEAARETQKALKSIVSWAWDGLKRAWNSVVNLFRKAAHAVGQFFVNIARLLKERAKKAAPLVWAALRGMSIALKYLSTPFIPGSDLATIAGFRHADGDIDLWCAPNAPSGAVATFSRRMVVASRLFELSTRILSVVTQLFLAVVRGAVFALGWLSALLSIYRLRERITRLLELGRAARDLVLLFDGNRPLGNLMTE